MSDTSTRAVSSAVSSLEDNLTGFGIVSGLAAIVLLWYMVLSSRFLAQSICLLANFVFLPSSVRIWLQGIHLAPLAGKVFLQKLQIVTPDVTLCILDVTLKVSLRKRKIDCRVAISMSGVEVILSNYSSRRQMVEALMTTLQAGGSVAAKTSEAHEMSEEFDFTASKPFAFLISPVIKFAIERGVVVIGNHALPSIAVLSFKRMSGSVTTSAADHMNDFYRMEASIRGHGVLVEMLENVDFEGDPDTFDPANVTFAPMANDPMQAWKRSFPDSRVNLDFGKNAAAMAGNLATEASGQQQRPGVLLSQTERLRRAASSGTHDSPLLGLGRQFRNIILDMPRNFLRRLPLLGDGSNESDANMLTARALRFKESGSARVVLRSEHMGLLYLQDVAGKAKHDNEEPPQWSIHIQFARSSLRYGPWEDRQRFLLQQFFLPPLYTDQKVVPAVSAGKIRTAENLECFIRFVGWMKFMVPYIDNDASNLHRDPAGKVFFDTRVNEPANGWLRFEVGDIPESARGNGAEVMSGDVNDEAMDEQIGDGQFAGDGTLDPIRLPGVVDPFKLQEGEDDRDDSFGSIHIKWPWAVPSSRGSEAQIALSLRQASIFSCVHNDNMLSCGALGLEVCMPFPLCWNECREFIVKLQISRPKFQLLREHIRTLTALGSNWVYGEPWPQEKFVPVYYKISVETDECLILMNATPDNVFLHPGHASNSFVPIRCSSLNASIDMPSVRWGAIFSNIGFQVDFSDMSASVLPGEGTSLDGLLGGQSGPTPFLLCHDMQLSGNYLYHYTFQPAFVDNFSMSVNGNGLTGVMQPYYLSVLNTLKCNYLGVDQHPATRAEFERRGRRNWWTVEVLRQRMESGTTYNAFESFVSVTFNSVELRFPRQLYDDGAFARAKLRKFCVETRSVFSFSNTMLNLSPITIEFPSSSAVGGTFALPSLLSDKDTEVGTATISGLCFSLKMLYGPLPESEVYESQMHTDVGEVFGVIDAGHLFHIRDVILHMFQEWRLEDLAIKGIDSWTLSLDLFNMSVSVEKVDIALADPTSILQIQANSGIHCSSSTEITRLCHSKMNWIIDPLCVTGWVPTTIRARKPKSGMAAVSSHAQNKWQRVLCIQTCLRYSSFFGRSCWEADSDHQYAWLSNNDRVMHGLPFLHEVTSEFDITSHSDSITSAELEKTGAITSRSHDSLNSATEQDNPATASIIAGNSVDENNSQWPKSLTRSRSDSNAGSEGFQTAATSFSSYSEGLHSAESEFEISDSTLHTPRDPDGSPPLSTPTTKKPNPDTESLLQCTGKLSVQTMKGHRNVFTKRLKCTEVRDDGPLPHAPISYKAVMSSADLPDLLESAWDRLRVRGSSGMPERSLFQSSSSEDDVLKPGVSLGSDHSNSKAGINSKQTERSQMDAMKKQEDRDSTGSKWAHFSSILSFDSGISIVMNSGAVVSLERIVQAMHGALPENGFGAESSAGSDGDGGASFSKTVNDSVDEQCSAIIWGTMDSVLCSRSSLRQSSRCMSFLDSHTVIQSSCVRMPGIVVDVIPFVQGKHTTPAAYGSQGVCRFAAAALEYLSASTHHVAAASMSRGGAVESALPPASCSRMLATCDVAGLVTGSTGGLVSLPQVRVNSAVEVLTQLALFTGDNSVTSEQSTPSSPLPRTVQNTMAAVAIVDCIRVESGFQGGYYQQESTSINCGSPTVEFGPGISRGLSVLFPAASSFKYLLQLHASQRIKKEVCGLVLKEMTEAFSSKDSQSEHRILLPTENVSTKHAGKPSGAPGMARAHHTPSTPDSYKQQGRAKLRPVRVTRERAVSGPTWRKAYRTIRSVLGTRRKDWCSKMAAASAVAMEKYTADCMNDIQRQERPERDYSVNISVPSINVKAYCPCQRDKSDAGEFSGANSKESIPGFALDLGGISTMTFTATPYEHSLIVHRLTSAIVQSVSCTANPGIRFIVSDIRQCSMSASTAMMSFESTRNYLRRSTRRVTFADNSSGSGGTPLTSGSSPNRVLSAGLSGSTLRKFKARRASEVGNSDFSSGAGVMMSPMTRGGSHRRSASENSADMKLRNQILSRTVTVASTFEGQLQSFDVELDSFTDVRVSALSDVPIRVFSMDGVETASRGQWQLIGSKTASIDALSLRLAAKNKQGGDHQHIFILKELAWNTQRSRSSLPSKFCTCRFKQSTSVGVRHLEGNVNLMHIDGAQLKGAAKAWRQAFQSQTLPNGTQNAGRSSNYSKYGSKLIVEHDVNPRGSMESFDATLGHLDLHIRVLPKVSLQLLMPNVTEGSANSIRFHSKSQPGSVQWAPHISPVQVRFNSASVRRPSVDFANAPVAGISASKPNDADTPLRALNAKNNEPVLVWLPLFQGTLEWTENRAQGTWDMEVEGMVGYMRNVINADVFSQLLTLQQSFMEELTVFLDKAVDVAQRKRKQIQAQRSVQQSHVSCRIYVQPCTIAATAPTAACIVDTGGISISVSSSASGLQADDSAESKSFRWSFSLSDCGISFGTIRSSLNPLGGDSRLSLNNKLLIKSNIAIKSGLVQQPVNTPHSTQKSALGPSDSIGVAITATNILMYPQSFTCVSVIVEHYQLAVKKYLEQRQALVANRSQHFDKKFAQVLTEVQQSVKRGGSEFRTKVKQGYAAVELSDLVVRAAFEYTPIVKSISSAHDLLLVRVPELAQKIPTKSLECQIKFVSLSITFSKTKDSSFGILGKVVKANIQISERNESSDLPALATSGRFMLIDQCKVALRVVSLEGNAITSSAVKMLISGPNVVLAGRDIAQMMYFLHSWKGEPSHVLQRKALNAPSLRTPSSNLPQPENSLPEGAQSQMIGTDMGATTLSSAVREAAEQGKMMILDLIVELGRGTVQLVAESSGGSIGDTLAMLPLPACLAQGILTFNARTMESTMKKLQSNRRITQRPFGELGNPQPHRTSSFPSGKASPIEEEQMTARQLDVNAVADDSNVDDSDTQVQVVGSAGKPGVSKQRQRSANHRRIGSVDSLGSMESENSGHSSYSNSNNSNSIHNLLDKGTTSSASGNILSIIMDVGEVNVSPKISQFLCEFLAAVPQSVSTLGHNDVTIGSSNHVTFDQSIGNIVESAPEEAITVYLKLAPHTISLTGSSRSHDRVLFQMSGVQACISAAKSADGESNSRAVQSGFVTLGHMEVSVGRGSESTMGIQVIDTIAIGGSALGAESCDVSAAALNIGKVLVDFQVSGFRSSKSTLLAWKGALDEVKKHASQQNSSVNGSTIDTASQKTPEQGLGEDSNAAEGLVVDEPTSLLPRPRQAVFFSFMLSEAAALAQLGHPAGECRFMMSGLQALATFPFALQVANNQQDWSLSFGLASSSLKTVGRLTSTMSLNKWCWQQQTTGRKPVSLVDPATGSGYLEFSGRLLHIWMFELAGFKCSIISDYAHGTAEHLLAIESRSPVWGRSRDYLEMEKPLRLQGIFGIEQLDIEISAETVPGLSRGLQEIRKSLEVSGLLPSSNSRGSALPGTSQSTNTLGSESQSTKRGPMPFSWANSAFDDHNPLQQQASSSSSSMHQGKSSDLESVVPKTKVLGDVGLLIGVLVVRIHEFQISEREYPAIQVQDAVIVLEQPSANAKNEKTDELSAQFLGVSIDMVYQQQSRHIIEVPGMELVLTATDASQQLFSEDIVSFTSDFSDAIKVDQRILSRFSTFQKLVSKFMRTLSPNKPVSGKFSQRLGDDSSEHHLGSERGPAQQVTLPHRTTVNQVIFEPRLAAMGAASPPLSTILKSMGVSNLDSIATGTYSGLMVPMRAVMEASQDTLEALSRIG